MGRPKDLTHQIAGDTVVRVEGQKKIITGFNEYRIVVFSSRADGRTWQGSVRVIARNAQTIIDYLEQVIPPFCP